MFGKIWNDTVSRVKTTAVEVQNQVNQRAARAREVILQYGKRATSEQLEQQLLSQIVNIDTGTDIEELCSRWLRYINNSNDSQCPRYHSNTDKEAKNNIQHVAAKQQELNSESTIQPIETPPRKTSPTYRWETFNSNLITRQDAIALQQFLFPEGNKPEDHQGETIENSPQSSNEQLTPKDQSKLLNVSTSLTDLMISFSNSGLTFKEIILKSELLEKLIIRIFRDPKLIKHLTGPLENYDNSQTHHKSSNLLLQLFDELLMGGHKLHRQMLSLLITMDPEWKGHVECMAKLISFLKWDWISERLLDFRTQILHDIKHASDFLENWNPPELYEDPNDFETSRHMTPSESSDGLIKHNIRILTSRKLVQLHQLLSANLYQSAERRKHQAKSVKNKLKVLANKISDKANQYEENTNLAITRQKLFEEESVQKFKDFEEKISSFSKDYHSFDEQLESLIKKQQELTDQLRAVEDEIREINLERSNFYSSIQKYQKQQQEQENIFSLKVSLEKSEQLSSEKKQFDIQNILSLTSDAQNTISSRLSGNANELEHMFDSIQGPTSKLLADNLEYEKERLLYENHIILNSNPLELAKDSPHSVQNTLKNQGQHLTHAESMNSSIAQCLNTQEQLDLIWSEFRSFALSCEKILTLPSQETSPSTLRLFSNEKLLRKPTWMSEEMEGEMGAELEEVNKQEEAHTPRRDDHQDYTPKDDFDFMKRLNELENLYITLKEHVSALNNLEGDDETKDNQGEDDVMLKEELINNIKSDSPLHTSEIYQDDEIEEDLDIDEFVEKYINDETAAALKHQF